jgi:hypothetical protein
MMHVSIDLRRLIPKAILVTFQIERRTYDQHPGEDQAAAMVEKAVEGKGTTYPKTDDASGDEVMYDEAYAQLNRMEFMVVEVIPIPIIGKTIMRPLLKNTA